MKYTLVAPVGEDAENIYVGVTEFPLKKIVLLASKENRARAARLQGDLKVLKVPVEVLELGKDIVEETFRAINEIKGREGEGVIVNVATGDKVSACVALSAAFVNGVKALGVKDGKPMLFPVLKFSYYNLISERKLAILEALKEGERTLGELTEKVKLSPPLVSYHIRGSAKTAGLLGLGLVEVGSGKGGVRVRLSPLGQLLIKGYV